MAGKRRMQQVLSLVSNYSKILWRSMKHALQENSPILLRGSHFWKPLF